MENTQIEDDLNSKISKGLFDRSKRFGINLMVSHIPIKTNRGLWYPDLTIGFENQLLAIIEFKKDDTTVALSSSLVYKFKSIGNVQGLYIVTPAKCFKLGKGDSQLKTMSFDNMLDDIAINAIKQTQRIDTSRVVASKDNDEKIRQLNKAKIVNQKLVLAESKKGENKDEALVKELERQNKEIDAQIESLTAVNDRHKQDKEIENNWDERIKKAFANLKMVTDPLDNQKRNSFVEWIVWIVIIIVSTILLFAWYNSFITDIPNLVLNKDPSYLKLMPYMLPIPIYIAILWIGIIQKGKARKVQLAIATLLFNIHYLESLLQMINKLSINADVAVDNINNLLKKIIEQYIQQIGKNDIDAKLMDNIEKEEDKDNPLIDKLTDIIKNLTSHG